MNQFWLKMLGKIRIVLGIIGLSSIYDNMKSIKK